MKNRLSIIQSQYIILKTNKFDIKKEDDQAFNDAIYLSVNINLFLELTRPANAERYWKQWKKSGKHQK